MFQYISEVEMFTFFWVFSLHMPCFITVSVLSLNNSYCKLRHTKNKFSCGKFIIILSFQISPESVDIKIEPEQ